RSRGRLRAGSRFLPRTRSVGHPPARRQLLFLGMALGCRRRSNSFCSCPDGEVTNPSESSFTPTSEGPSRKPPGRQEESLPASSRPHRHPYFGERLESIEIFRRCCKTQRS